MCQEGFEFQEPPEVYGMANPAPARMFDASGRLLARAELPELVNGAQRLVAQPRTGNRFSQVIYVDFT